MAAMTTSAAANFEFIYETSDYPGGISADGSKAVIESAGGNSPAIYTRGGGAPLQPVTGLPGFQFSHSLGLSGDGLTVIGRSHGFGQTQQAFRWTQAGGATSLGDPLAPTSVTWANAISNDGSIIAGHTQLGSSHTAAWRWTASGGVERLSGYQYYQDSEAFGVSGDGSVIVGTASGGSAYIDAFRWTAAGGFELLRDESIGSSNARAISADGSTIIGQAGFASGTPAFRWTQAEGFVQLQNDIPDVFTDFPLAVSANGSVIVGQASSPRGYEAWMWDEAHGVRLLTDLASEMGIDLGGQYLESATSISADGTIIAGHAFGPQGGMGYIMVVPEPSTCASLLAIAAARVICRRRAMV
jgi:uncharacterized membrane protein